LLLPAKERRSYSPYTVAVPTELHLQQKVLKQKPETSANTRIVVSASGDSLGSKTFYQKLITNSFFEYLRLWREPIKLINGCINVK
jgi:hypothetical protein